MLTEEKEYMVKAKDIWTIKGEIGSQGEDYNCRRRRKRRCGETEYEGDWDDTMEIH